MAKRYHRRKLHQLIAAACLSATAVPPLLVSPAMAVTTTITAVAPGPYYLIGEESLVVTSSGNITGGTIGVNVTNTVVAGSITNSGQIHGTNYGILGGGSIGSITNNADATISASASAAIAIVGGAMSGDISNSGTIDGSTGILVTSSTIAGSIQNAAGGFITGNQTGILVGNSSIVAGGISNNGTITGGQRGINIYNSVIGEVSESGNVIADIVNLAGRTIRGTSSAGIYLQSSTVTGAIKNSGNILGQYYGLYIGSGSTIGSITNTGGTIQGSSSAGIYLADSEVTGDISNSGTIQGDTGIVVVSGSTIAGSILNAAGGSITGNQTGILVGNSSIVAGGISNNGTITGGQRGLNIFNSVIGEVSESGNVIADIVNMTGRTIEGNSSAGIYLQSSTVTGAIKNSGNILGAYYGLYLGNSSTVGSITNYAGASILATSSGSGGIYLSESEVTGLITNAGTISGPAGIYAVSSTLGGITNNVGGQINGTGSAGIMISQSEITGGISNSGTITGANTGIAVQGSSILAGGISNSGTITGGDYAIFVSSPWESFTITNTGLLDGAVELAGTVELVPSTLNLNGTAGRITGAVTGGEFATVNVNGTFTTENTFNVGAFNINSGGVFNMAHGVTAASAVTNAGILSVAAGTTATITGNYTQSTAGVFRTGAASLTNYGKLVVAGIADLSASNKIDVNVSSGNTLANGDVLTGVLTADTLTAGTLTVTDNSAMWNFTGAVNGNQIDLTTVQGLTFAEAVRGGTVSPAASGVATALDAIQTAGTSGDMQTVLDAFGALGTSEEVAAAVSQLMPGLAGGGAQVALGLAGGGGAKVVHGQMGGRNGLSSGAPLFKDRVVWAQPFYSWTDQNERKGVVGYTADSYGLAMGADGQVNPQWRLGAALSFAKGDVDGDSPVTRNNLKIDTYQVSLYATDRLSDATSLNLQAGFGINDNESTRHIQFGGLDRIASGDYTSWHTMLDGELEHRYRLNEKTTLASTLRAQYSYVSVEDYTETGAGAINLHMDKNNEDSLILSMGGKLGYALNDRMKLTGHLGAGYDLMASQASVTSTFTGGGPAFVTQGLDPSPLVLTGGIGLEILNANGITVTAKYDVDGREDYLNQTATINFRMPF